jgi:hypothetical protein
MEPQARRRFYRYVHATDPTQDPVMYVVIHWTEGPRPGTRIVSLWRIDPPEPGEDLRRVALDQRAWVFLDTVG